MRAERHFAGPSFEHRELLKNAPRTPGLPQNSHPDWRSRVEGSDARIVRRNSSNIYFFVRLRSSGFRCKRSRENPSNSVIGINIKAMRIGMTINKALSVPVRKAIRAAPGNNISHPSKHNPKDQGHSLLRTLCNFEGSLLHVVS